MTRHIELVTHCWNYSRLLTYQLSSLALHPPRAVSVTATVFLSYEDAKTRRVIDYFQRLPLPPTVTLFPWHLPTHRLLVRGVGRNLAALTTRADWVWFTDCDYAFGPGALDALADRLASVGGDLAYPRRVLRSRSQADGDGYVAAVGDGPRLAAVRPEDFESERMTRAIGGIQICRGEVARSRGYLGGAAFHDRVATQWVRTHEDVQFREELGTPGRAVRVPNVFRIRHSRRGWQDPGVQL
jgi:hypothetical protein